MQFSKKTLQMIMLGTLFTASFLVVFAVIVFTQSAHALPESSSALIAGGMDFTVAPPANSTNVPLNTAIIVDAFASASLNDLRLTPYVPMSYIDSTSTGPLTYKTTFVPAELLQPNTTYTVSVTIINAPASWSFSTTSEPFTPTASYILAVYAPWISLGFGASVTGITGLVISFRQKHKKQA